MFRGTAGIPPEQTNLFRLPRNSFFLSEIANPSLSQ
jgi:hypothetical protein